MRIPLTCMECVRISLEELGLPSQTSVDTSRGSDTRLEVQEDNLYKLTCSEGHVTYTALQQKKFQILFEIGAHAIADGYYREAVASFTSSLERFYEFFVRAYLYQQGKNDEEVSLAWKTMRNSSVQQIGAFSLAFNLAFNDSAPLLSNKDTQFRNNVIHQGLIPTREQALLYGKNIIELIYPTFKKMATVMSDGLWQTTRAHLVSSFKDTCEPRATLNMPLIILDPDSDPNESPDLLAAVTRFEAIRRYEREGSLR